MKQEKFMDALADLNKAIEMDPEYTKAYMRRGQVYTHLKEFEKALQDYHQVKSRDPRYPDIENSIRYA